VAHRRLLLGLRPNDHESLARVFDLAEPEISGCLLHKFVVHRLAARGRCRLPGRPRTDVLSKNAEAGVVPRLEEAAKRGWISEQQRASLEQLWEHRNNVHLKFLENSERDLYQVEHVNAPHAAVLDLMAKSKAWHAARQA